jgi:hypothetical protein
LVTLVATPTENAVDDEPAISSFKEVANRTGLIIHNEVDKRAYDKATIMTNELHIDIEISY